MHLAGNLSDLFLSLWRGTIECAPTDAKESWDWAIFRDEDMWSAHGLAVERAGSYIPGSFDRKPRNIAEKLNTDYKTWEFHLYIFCLAPALLYQILPERYWTNFCKLVRGIQIMSQHRIKKEDLEHAYVLFCCWERDFELLYYKLQENRLHFIRPCVHQVLHLVTETMHKGPPIMYAQWTMERTIGNLGQEIRQPSQPYANLAQEGVNALLASMPELDDSSTRGPPRLSVQLGGGYVLLFKRDKRPWLPEGQDALVIAQFLGGLQQFQRWARLQLPNGQVVRSLWREQLKQPEKLRVSRNVKFIHAGQEHFGEVRYFTRLATRMPVSGQMPDRDGFVNVALIRLYTPPDDSLLLLSSQTVVSSKLTEEIIVVDVKKIKSVIGMIPHKPTLASGITEDRYFVVEKPGLDVLQLGIQYNSNRDDDDDEGDDVE
ncbi:hypothetical protein M404DRAFT_171804 [Pisolithus tinctorius Marx 270]|uniref:Uncharacterized protein n=1 Tax=Pisolithus tinctorius Marx 270 TaxID=870435 RepID=A0A0C3I7F5_PISTI|nr:hypothetical protein M404DRAFT_171804 [Pisolithus tinctorius Marx 270]